MTSPASFLPADLAAAIDRGHRVAVVTPNRRLALSLKRAYDRHRRDAGALAWESADILPWPAFLERTARALSLRAEGGESSVPANAAQRQLLFEQAVKASGAAGLMSLPAAARQAVAAWDLAHAWRLFPALAAEAQGNEDAAAFADWSQRYRKLCAAAGLADPATLPDRLADHLARDGAVHGAWPAALWAAGFDIVTPQQAAWFAAARDAGIEVVMQDIPGVADARAVRAEFEDEVREAEAIAGWARARLAANPAARLGIVVPDLNRRRGTLARALDDALRPGARAASPAATLAPPHFDISLGRPLADHALARDALALVALSLDAPVPFAEASAALRSPFIAMAQSEFAARAELDTALRERAGTTLTRAALAAWAARTPATAALSRVLANVAALPAAPGTADGMSRHFRAVLAAWGFPGEAPLDSLHHQLLGKLSETLDNLASLAAAQPRMPAAVALGHWRRIAADTVFQPEAPGGSAGPAIQVMGVLESAGQRVDHLWVAGLDESGWPLPVKPLPLIPASIQRRAGVIEAHAGASLALDRRITDDWRRAATEVVFSHALAQDGEGAGEARAASALVRDLPIATLAPPPAPPPAWPLARIPDAPLTPLAAPLAVAGGASLLRDRAACAFRAFARARLRARPMELPHDGLDAAERGTLLHGVLERLWGRLESHAALVALDDEGRDRLIDASVGETLAALQAKRPRAGLAGRFAELERQRLNRLMREWLDYEKERAPFTVAAREHDIAATVGPLALKLRVDRIDRLADGGVALIDYKTGQARLASWLGDRPDEPQLPLYHLALDEPVAVLAFARVKRGPRRKVFGFVGAAAAPGLLPDVGTIESQPAGKKAGYASWDTLTAAWEQALPALATDIAAGRAVLDPKQGPLSCALCDLHGLCRVGALALPEGADDEAGEGA